MTKIELELSLYMGDSSKIINWLEKEGIKNEADALQKLKPYVKSILLETVSISGGSLAGTHNCLQTVISHFKIKDKQ